VVKNALLPSKLIQLWTNNLCKLLGKKNLKKKYMKEAIIDAMCTTRAIDG
jgi:hypothetical protein